jgi:ferredoxin
LYTLIVFGNASQSIIAQIAISQEELLTDLLTLLQKYHIPIASSCMGEGICKKCILNGGQLACKTNIKDLISSAEGHDLSIKITLDYL